MATPQKVVIFDFDGTLADSVPIIRSIYTTLAVKYKWPVLTDDVYAELRKGTLRQAKNWSGVSFWQFPLVVRSVKKLMTLEAEKVKLFPGVVDLIHELHANDVELYVLSRNSTETIERVLARYKLQHKMRIIVRRKRTLGSKAAAIRKLTRKMNYDKKYVWMVGDEVRDVEAGHRAGVKSIAVAWGIQDISILERSKPTHAVDNVNEIKRILKIPEEK